MLFNTPFHLLHTPKTPPEQPLDAPLSHRMRLSSAEKWTSVSPWHAAHDALAAEAGDGSDQSGTHSFCSVASSVVALLRAGEVALYDSRLLHGGGAHLPAPAPEPPAPWVQPERVLFTLTFIVAGGGDAANRDMHGAGSILPELAAQRFTLGDLRGRDPRTTLDLS